MIWFVVNTYYAIHGSDNHGIPEINQESDKIEINREFDEIGQIEIGRASGACCDWTTAIMQSTGEEQQNLIIVMDRMMEMGFYEGIFR